VPLASTPLPIASTPTRAPAAMPASTRPRRTDTATRDVAVSAAPIALPPSAPAPTDGDPDASRWDAVRRRDARRDGVFVYAVRTTGIYCRPSCASRPARRENVRFFDTPEAAAAAGFRACLRCRPDAPPLAERHRALVLDACAALERSESGISLDALAAAADMTPRHFHRVFKATVGVSPKAYFATLRTRRAQAALQAAPRVTDAIYDAGFGSSSRFYGDADASLGMSPSAFRAGGAGQRIRWAVAPCALGTVLVAATDRGVCAIEFGDTPQALAEGLRARFPKAALVDGDAAFREWVDRVLAFVERPGEALDLPLDVRGTAFQRRVWEALRAIPRGRTASYAEVARAIGRPEAARAVAAACASNAVAVAIPCHRVVRSDGSPSGYRWGAARKVALLRRERDADDVDA
jgi:AraC family transcriptional regulator of adaptative response/methylated-DNA-[protein]-cysteine methyltransferase